MNREFVKGMKDGIPIAIGYFAVSFSFGIVATQGGLSVLQAAVTSLTNVTSAGQFAGLKIMVAGGLIIELLLTQFIINLRYALMSLSLSQKLDESVTLWQRLMIAFANTDEVFAVAMAHRKSLTWKYMMGLEIIPVLGWTSGTAVGAVACNLLPDSLSVALSVALYGMFVAIVVPVAKKSRPVMMVVLLAIVLSCVLTYVPVFAFIPDSMICIICTVVASAVGAWLFPVPNHEEDS